MATKTPTFQAVLDKAHDALQSIELSYEPTPEERRLRATFWAAIDAHPIVDVDNITAANVAQITGDSRIHRWWSKPGFKEWFANKIHIQAKAEFALDLLLDSFVQIALDPDPRSISAKVAAAKLLADMRGYTSKSRPQRALDADLPEDPKQLEAHVRKLLLQVPVK